ncbi:MAG: 50S ribosomal protein L18 [Ignavibacteriaceae bacterium]|nr:50S ribosomal protein L18 [Ignavibacteriaceae bacterium]
MSKVDSRKRIKAKVRKKVSGTPDRPRLTVYRSLNHIYAQLIDDVNGKTLVAYSTKTKDSVKDLESLKGKTSKSKLVGKCLAEKALAQSITTCVFDRNGYRYHGRVKALAEGAREGGLKF